MAEVRRYVDTDVVGGAGDGTSWADAYSSLNAGENAEVTDLDSANDYLVFECRASSNSADTAAVLVSGWGTSTSDPLQIEASSGEEAVKTGWDTGRYRLDVSGAIPIQITDDHVRLKGLQIKITNLAWSYAVYIGNYGINAGAKQHIDSCYITADATTDHGIRVYEAQADVEIFNTIVTDEGGGLRGGIYIEVGAANILNCVVVGASAGYGGVQMISGVTVVVKDTASFNNADDFNDAASSTIDYCASDDGDGTNAISPSGADWDNEFTDPSNYDFTLESGGNCAGGGTNDPGSGLYSVDIEGDSYTTDAWDVGVDALVPSSFSKTVNDSTHSHSSDSADISQEHSISANEATSAHSADSPTATQLHNLSVASSDHAQSVDTPTTTEIFSKTTASADHTHSADAPSVDVEATKTAADATSAHSADSPSINIEATKAVNKASHSQAANSPSVSQEHDLNVDSSDHAHSVDEPTAAQTGATVVHPADHAHAADSPAATQIHVLTSDDATSAHAADSPAITEIVQVGVNDADHAHAAETPTFVLTVSKQPIDSSHAHAAETPSATEIWTITVDEAGHGVTSDSPAANQILFAQPIDAAHAHASDAPTISQAYAISPDAADHGHVCDEISISGLLNVGMGEVTFSVKVPTVTMSEKVPTITFS